MRIKHAVEKMPVHADPLPVFKWAFMAKRKNGDTIFLDDHGFSITIKHIKFWQGTASQARTEARQRGEKFGVLFQESLEAVTYQKLDPKSFNNPGNLQMHLDNLNKLIGTIQANRKHDGQNRNADTK